MTLLEYWNLLDDALLVAIHAIIILFVIGHMNAMTVRTPNLQVVSWWCIGVGSFSEICQNIYSIPNEWGSVMFGLGALFLVMIHTRPEWRPLLWDRRKSHRDIIPVCGRRKADPGMQGEGRRRVSE